MNKILAIILFLVLIGFLIAIAYGIYVLTMFLKEKHEESFCGGACAMLKGA